MAKKDADIGREKEVPQSLFLPVDTVPEEEDLLVAIPELAAYEEFSAFIGNDRDKWIRYVAFYIDKGSALVKSFKDVRKRQQEALKAAGIPKGSPDVQAVVRGAHKGVNAMISRWFWMMNDLNYEYLLSGQEMVRQSMEAIRNNTLEADLSDDKVVTTQSNKVKMWNELRVPIAELTRLEREVFADNEHLKDVVDKSMISTKNMGFVERMALQENNKQ